MSNEYDSDNCSAVTIYDVTINDIDSNMQVLTDKKRCKAEKRFENTDDDSCTQKVSKT